MNPERQPRDLYPEVNRRFIDGIDLMREKHGPDPEIRLLCAHRSTARQAELYQAHLEGGPHASPPGKSLHEFLPSAALDFGCFSKGTYLIGEKWLFLYQDFGEIMESLGFEWGGRWAEKKFDPSHVQPKGYTLEMARRKVPPIFLSSA
jgi:hypothetical protein